MSFEIRIPICAVFSLFLQEVSSCVLWWYQLQWRIRHKGQVLILKTKEQVMFVINENSSLEIVDTAYVGLKASEYNATTVYNTVIWHSCADIAQRL